MKSHTVYECDYCNFTSSNVEEMKKHEAAHEKLNVTEMHEYMEKRAYFNYIKAVVESGCNRPHSMDLYNIAKQALQDFEANHGII